MDEKAPGKLYIVATPIGNLGDLSHRAEQTLRDADFIAAEDTRVTQKLLNRFGIKKPMVSCFRHNEERRAAEIIARIAGGENCALCSDAGTPAISDPGEDIVLAAVDAGIAVVPVPGPSAVIAALSVSGIFTGRFCFEGFLPMNKKTRRIRLSEVENEPRTLVFYEAPHKLKNTLNDLLAVLGDREIAVARELTKLHEEVWRTHISEALAHYRKQEPKGEFVLVVAGKKAGDSPPVYSLSDAAAMAGAFQKEGLSPSEAARRAAQETGVPRSDIYRDMQQRREGSGE